MTRVQAWNPLSLPLGPSHFRESGERPDREMAGGPWDGVDPGFTGCKGSSREGTEAESFGSKAASSNLQQSWPQERSV